MPRPLKRDERKAQTREALLDAASALFARRGFETATIDEIAAEAGFTKGAFYSNFGSKTDLLAALLERRIEVQSTAYPPLLEGTNIEGLLKKLEPSGTVSEPEKQFLMLAMEFWLRAMRDETTRVLFAEQYERAREIVGGFLTTAGYQPGAPGHELSPREMAILIDALGTGLKLQVALDPSRVSLGLAAEAFRRLMGSSAAAEPLVSSGPDVIRDSRSG